MGAVIVVLVAAGSALGGGVNGTWAGRMIYSQEIGNIPTSAYPTVKLAVGPATISAVFHGRTQAAHDPESATSTCAMRFQFRGGLSSDGWRVYEEVGMPVVTGTGGPPDMSGCQYYTLDGKSRVLLRVRPAGNKLRAEFGEFGLRAPEFGAGYLRGYLSTEATNVLGEGKRRGGRAHRFRLSGLGAVSSACLVCRASASKQD